MRKPKKLATSESTVISLLLFALMLNTGMLLSNQSLLSADSIKLFSYTLPTAFIFAISLISLTLSVVLCIWFIRCMTREINVRLEQNEDLHLTNIAVKASSNGVAIADSDKKFIFVNPAFEKITGYQLDDVSGKNPKILASGRHESVFLQKNVACNRKGGALGR